MTRKDYVLLATTMRSMRPINYEAYTKETEYRKQQQYTAVQQWRGTCLALATELQADNSRFNRSRFLKECGVKK